MVLEWAINKKVRWGPWPRGYKAVLKKIWKDEEDLVKISDSFKTIWYGITASEYIFTLVGLRARNDPQKPIIKMNTKTVHELRSITKDKCLRGYYKLKKADLVALLLEQSAEELPTLPPRTRGKERRSALPVKIISSPQGWIWEKRHEKEQTGGK